MPLQSTNPISDPEGNVYPYFALHMSVSPIWEDTNIRGPMTLRLVPFKYLEDGTPIKYEAGSKYVSIFDVFTQAQNDPVLAEALGTIMYAVQGYISAKGM